MKIRENTRKRFRFMRWSIALLVFTTVVILSIVWFWRPGTMFKQFNAGHQLGGDMYDDIPGNTIAVFQRAIRELEKDPGYKYSECDLRETKDHEIVIFHDWGIGRLVPDTAANRTALGVDRVSNIPINELTLRQIQGLELVGQHKIPTLEEVLRCAVQLELKKPLLLEIKVLGSDTGRNKTLELATKYRDQSELDIHFLAFRRNVSRSFPDETTWLQRFSDSGFRVYQAFRPKTKAYDLCENW